MELLTISGHNRSLYANSAVKIASDTIPGFTSGSIILKKILNLDAPSKFGSGNVVGMTFVGIISGLTGSANIAIDMSTRNSNSDYVRCDLTITYV